MPKKNPDKASVKCKVCGLKRMKIRSEKPTPSGRRMFTNELGQFWNGNICPKCNVQRIDPYCKRYRKIPRLNPEEFIKKVQERYQEILARKRKKVLKAIVNDMADEKAHEDMVKYDAKKLKQKEEYAKEEIQRTFEQNLSRHENDCIVGKGYTESIQADGVDSEQRFASERLKGEDKSLLGDFGDDGHGDRLVVGNSEGGEYSLESNSSQTTKTSQNS